MVAPAAAARATAPGAVAARQGARTAAARCPAPRRQPQQQQRAGRRRLAVAATAAPTQAASPFAAVQNEEQLFGLLKAGASSGTVRAGLAAWPQVLRAPCVARRLARHKAPLAPPATPRPMPLARMTAQVPPRIIEAFHELYGNYKAAVLAGGAPGADADFVARVMASVRAGSAAGRRRGAPGRHCKQPRAVHQAAVADCTAGSRSTGGEWLHVQAVPPPPHT